MQRHTGDVEQRHEVDSLVAAVCPATDSDDSSYVGMRRFLLREKALKGTLARHLWECNGAGYLAYRLFIQKSKECDNSLSPAPSSRPDDSARCTSFSGLSTDFGTGDNFDHTKGRLSINSNNSQNVSSLKGEEIIAKEPAYSFVGMHCIFDECKSSVNVLRFGHRCSEILAFAASDGNLHVCSVDPPKILQNLKGHTKEITDFDWSLKNQYICSSSLDKSVRVWDVINGQCVRVLYERSAQLSIRFNPVNNNLLIVSNGEKEVKMMVPDPGFQF